MREIIRNFSHLGHGSKILFFFPAICIHTYVEVVQVYITQAFYYATYPTKWLFRERRFSSYYCIFNVCAHIIIVTLIVSNRRKRADFTYNCIMYTTIQYTD